MRLPLLVPRQTVGSLAGISSFGARLDGGTSTPVAQVETAEPEYETTYTYVADTDIEFVFYIRSSGTSRLLHLPLHV